MNAPFTGPDHEAVAVATSFWTRMTDLPDPGWRVFLGPAEQASAQQLILTDRNGCPLARSPLLAAALRRNTGTIDLGLADGSGRMLATGRIGRRRSVARTLAAAVRVAGPLAVMATQRQPTPVGPSTPASRGALLLADAAGGGWFVRRLTRAAVTSRYWACAPIEAPSAASEHLRLVGAWQNGQTGFWADPCVIAHEGRTWLFVEELDRRVGRGYIVAAEVMDGHLRNPRVVLANDHHLSFPQVGLHNGRWLATIETCAGHNPVYEFDEPGGPWRSCPDYPPLPPHTADAVLDFETGLLVGTDAKTDGDSVLVNYQLEGRTWVPLPGATRVDVVWSRGGGTIDQQRRIRAVQDCSGTYGVGLGWTGSTDPDQHLAQWRTKDLQGGRGRWSGIHTMTWDPQQDSVWIDGWRRRFSVLGWRQRLIEQRHFKHCQG